MRGHARDRLFGLGGDEVDHLVVLAVRGAGEEEVVPDEDAAFVAGVEELLGREVAAAPDAQEVGVARDGLVDAPGHAVGGGAAGEGVVGDPVVAADPHGTAVDDERPAGAEPVRVSSTATVRRPRRTVVASRHGVGVFEGCLEAVQRLGAVPDRPPERGVVDRQGDRRLVAGDRPVADATGRPAGSVSSTRTWAPAGASTRTCAVTWATVWSAVEPHERPDVLDPPA